MSGNNRQPGSNLGRSAANWDAAYLYYVGLPTDKRSYRAVADKFKVSVRTVERHARENAWRQKAREIDQAAADRAVEQLLDNRAELLVETERLVGASLASLANQLHAGVIKPSFADLPRLHKVITQVWAQQDTAAVQMEAVGRPPVDPIDPVRRKVEVLRALDAAGVLQRLLRGDGAADPEPSVADEREHEPAVPNADEGPA